jgi:glycosyltransferase involved in cell wall biosynthesis
MILELIQFITSIPWGVTQGSGCYVGTRTLVDALRGLGLHVEVIRPGSSLLPLTASRVLFNERLRWRRFHGAVTIGVDTDGYAVNRGRSSPPHIACIKGVLGDAVRFETGLTRASLAFQAELEKRHARRADLVITVSRYCADRLEELYGVKGAVVVPELINLNAWRQLFRGNPGVSARDKFVILSVCRFYPRKRLEVLLRAAGLLRTAIPELEVRIVGDGPELPRLLRICQDLRLGSAVQWLGDVSISSLAQEYNGCNLFCLPSAQEGFGIVFLEAMAAGKPIVAARASAVPEVVRNGILVEPDNPEALAEGIFQLHRNPALCRSLSSAGLRDVEQFEMHRVAEKFLTEIGTVAPGVRLPQQKAPPVHT